MAPAESLFSAPPFRVRVSLEPVHNQLQSLLLLSRTEKLSGLGEWVMSTVAALPTAQLHTNHVIMEGLHFAIQPDRSWPDFTRYIDHLAAQKPEDLRDKVLRGCPPFLSGWRTSLPPMPDPEVVLVSVEAYIDHLHRSFPGVELNVPIEIEAYQLMREPERMQEVIVDHLRVMWHDVLEAEWARSLPLLQESVAAFQQIDLSGDILDVAGQVIGQEVPDKWQRMIADAPQVVFVPSAHIGPYVGQFNSAQVLWLLFGARLPEGARVAASPVSRSELVVRLSALNDDTRLRILALISQQGELCAPDIMARLGLSQSATSRHLQQLSATGYLSERRRESAKCYTLNRARIGDTFAALERFLNAV